MSKVLVPVDSTLNSLQAVRHVVNEFVKNPAIEIHILNVQTPFSMHITQFSSKRDREALHREQAETALRPTRQVLAFHSVPYVVHVEVGSKAQVIADTARRLQCDHILMGTARKNAVTRVFDDSVTNKVLELTTVPVQIIVGNAISRWKRFGIPAGLGTTVGLFLLAGD